MASKIQKDLDQSTDEVRDLIAYLSQAGTKRKQALKILRNAGTDVLPTDCATCSKVAGKLWRGYGGDLNYDHIAHALGHHPSPGLPDPRPGAHKTLQDVGIEGLPDDCDTCANVKNYMTHGYGAEHFRMDTLAHALEHHPDVSEDPKQNWLRGQSRMA